MKIIGFSTGRVGREANIDRLVKAIMTASGYEAEFVKLTDYTYGGCKGCVQLCSHPQECKLDDAVSPFYHKLKEADAVVLERTHEIGRAHV